MPYIARTWKPRRVSSKKSSKRSSKKVSFRSRYSRKKMYKSSKKSILKKNQQSQLDSKNNQELNTYDLQLPGPKKIPYYSIKLLKDQPLQTYKYQNQYHNEVTRSSQGYNFINILRGTDIEKLFSFVPNFYEYVQPSSLTANNAILYDNNTARTLVLKDHKIYIQNVKVDIKVKNSCNVGQNVTMYLLKPRYDMQYMTRKYFPAGTNKMAVDALTTMETIYENGITDNNNIKVVPGAQTSITGKNVGITPFESCYITRNFKIMTKYTRVCRLSDGGNIDLTINIPIKRVIGFDRLENNYSVNEDGTYNKWVKGFSYIIMFVYYGDQGINDNAGIIRMQTMPCSNLQLLDYKVDFKVCNSQKAKVAQLGSINVAVGGTDKTMDEQGNTIAYSTLNTLLP